MLESDLQLSRSAMSYSTYPTVQPGQPATTFPYGAYHPSAYGQALTHTAGATSYPSGYPTYSTGVTSYGTWPGYAYNYAPGSQHHIQTTSATRPTVQTVGMPTTTSAHTPASAAPRTTTFTAYTPSYLKESVVAAGTGGATGRGSRKQANFKGMFTKER